MGRFFRYLLRIRRSNNPASKSPGSLESTTGLAICYDAPDVVRESPVLEIR